MLKTLIAAAGLSLLAPLAALAAEGSAELGVQPEIVETRTVRLSQKVTLNDIPTDAGQVELWVPVPGDAAWQRVLDRRVVEAPGTWQVVTQPQGTFIHVTVDEPTSPQATVVVECTVERQGTRVDMRSASATSPIHGEFFAEHLDRNAPLMSVSPRVQAMADAACGDETDVARQAAALIDAVRASADHYSINDSVPTCGRGAAEDCMTHGGGCCTDLHSLFIALARARDIPARMQYGYRLLDGRDGREFNPGYRCWVEFFVPGSGWLATDIVAADNARESARDWVSLSSTRVWLWEGRSFELSPAAKHGAVDTMICGWAEIDGRSVDPLPSHDGSPSKLERTVTYEILGNTRGADTPALPQ